MYGYCYIFPVQFYIIKLAHRAYKMQLEGNSILVKLSSKIYFGEEYHYILRLIGCLHTFDVRLKNSKYGLQSTYVYEKEGERKKPI